MNDHDVVFFGSGDFAYLTLKGLLKRDINIKLVVTAPDRPRGRGRKPRPTQVKLIALEHKLPVITPPSVKKPEVIEEISSINPQFFVLTDYGKIIPDRLLRLPRKAPLNIHPSLLPAYRGAAPLERAMMACEKVTGVTIMIMDSGIDTGPILLQERTEIGKTETKGELAERLASIGVELIVRAITEFDRITPTPQSEDGASYAPKISKEELWIDWNNSARFIACKINALSPRPGARARFDGNYIKPMRARTVDGGWGEPGNITIIDRKRLIVAASDGGVEILELMPEGRRTMKAVEYLSGHSPSHAC